MKQVLFFCFAILVLINSSCKSSKEVPMGSPQYCAPRIAFYNVENLFDTLDTPDFADEDFTPTGRQQWNTERYTKKLESIAKVIEGMDFPAFIGVCEVENATVLADLLQQPKLKSRDYGLVHYDSPDFRGIDVAMIYNKRDFKIKSSKIIPIHFPAAIIEDYTTRDILMVEGIFRKSQTIHFFINHWPSRRGGVAESEPRRVYVAEQLRQAVDSIFNNEPKSAIVIMGDFNDETSNKSIKQTLGAAPLGSAIQDNQLYNCFAKPESNKMGSYNYRGNWNMLDQIIVSDDLASEGDTWTVQQPTIYKADWMIFKHNRYGELPNRTYGGPNYYGGISDHFPVYVDLVMK